MPVPSLLAAIAGCAAPPSELARPNRVALGPDGSVYVSDFHNDRLVVLDRDGNFVRTFGRRGLGRNQLWRVTAMSVDPDGALVIANRRPESDAAGSETRFELIRFVDGEEVQRIALDGRALQPDGWIDGIVRGAGDTWLVADSTHGEIVEVDTAGRRVGMFGGIPRPDAAPSGFARDGRAVWVVEQHRHRLTRIAPGGDRRELAFRDDGHGPPRFPGGIALCPAGSGAADAPWLAIADLGNHRLQRYGLDGTWLGEFAPAARGPDLPVQLMDVAVSADCSRLYLVDSKGDRLLIATPDGAILREVHAW
jgi:sugar lactone lactonase YvrE